MTLLRRYALLFAKDIDKGKINISLEQKKTHEEMKKVQWSVYLMHPQAFCSPMFPRVLCAKKL